MPMLGQTIDHIGKNLDGNLKILMLGKPQRCFFRIPSSRRPVVGALSIFPISGSDGADSAKGAVVCSAATGVRSSGIDSSASVAMCIKLGDMTWNSHKRCASLQRREFYILLKVCKHLSICTHRYLSAYGLRGVGLRQLPCTNMHRESPKSKPRRRGYPMS